MTTPTATGMPDEMVTETYERGGTRAFVADCADYEAFASLPAEVRFDGRTYTKVGWSAGRGAVHYHTNARVAVRAAVRGWRAHGSRQFVESAGTARWVVTIAGRRDEKVFRNLTSAVEHADRILNALDPAKGG